MQHRATNAIMPLMAGSNKLERLARWGPHLLFLLSIFAVVGMLYRDKTITFNSPETAVVQGPRWGQVTIPYAIIEGLTFESAFDELGSIGNTRFAVDWNELRRLGITPATRVKTSGRIDMMFGSALADMFLPYNASDGVAFAIDNGKIQVTTRSAMSRRMSLRSYAVSEIVAEYSKTPGVTGFDAATLASSLPNLSDSRYFKQAVVATDDCILILALPGHHEVIIKDLDARYESAKKGNRRRLSSRSK